MRRQSCFSSLTSAMFTQRKIFSSSLTISAARVELTGTTFETICAYSPAAARPLAGLMPPTTFGICARPKLFVAGILALRRKREIEIGRHVLAARASVDRAPQPALLPASQGSAGQALPWCRDTSCFRARSIASAADSAQSLLPSARRSSGPARAVRPAAWERRSARHPCPAAARNPSSRRSVSLSRAGRFCRLECAGCTTAPRSACPLSFYRGRILSRAGPRPQSAAPAAGLRSRNR